MARLEELMVEGRDGDEVLVDRRKNNNHMVFEYKTRKCAIEWGHLYMMYRNSMPKQIA